MSITELNKEITAFLEHINLLAVLDHGGRAGNGFFVTIFDQHPEVLDCPWMHYTYSYILAYFGESHEIETKEVIPYWTQTYYFRYVYNDLDDAMAQDIYRFGGDPEAPVDREKVRRVFDMFLASRKTISRKELVSITFLAYAHGINRSLDPIKYILVSDAVSLRSETPSTGFSGRIIDLMVHDFENAKLVSLVRDPRAQFASSRHQFVNSLGNMYDIRIGNWWQKLKRLRAKKLAMRDGCVFLYWLLYMAAAAKVIYRFKRKYKILFRTVRNEDLNRNFVSTIKDLCQWLSIGIFPDWMEEPYGPTMVGVPWKGTGAYNNRYQQYRLGLLENDPDEVSLKVAGPNEYVTRRWKTRLSKTEIEIMEFLFYDEIQDLGYEFTLPPGKRQSRWGFFRRVWLPFRGELPTWTWIRKGLRVSRREFLERLWYSIAFPPFYILLRILLIREALTGYIFGLANVMEKGEGED